MVSRLLPFVLIGLPLVEIAGFVLVGRWLGVLATLALVVLAGLVGAAVLRRTGLKVLTGRGLGATAQSQAEAVGEGLLLAIAGVLLIVPGFFGDIVGLILLIPQVRQGMLRFLAKRFNVVVREQGFSASSEGPSRIVPPETIELEPEDWRPRD
jgi:UPF0716 protein FxsA